MKRIAMLTTFCDYTESYSLCQIARQQLRMLKDNPDYEVLFINRTGERSWEGLADRYLTIPDFIMDNDGSSANAVKASGMPLESMIAATFEVLETALSGIDVVITHDLIYQSSNHIQDVAAAMCSKAFPAMRWLHWVHSATPPAYLGKQVLANEYRNSLIVYPNNFDRNRVAANFKVPASHVAFVPHPLDYEEFFGWHPLTAKLAKAHRLLDSAVIGCYPLRLDRGKQPEMVIEIFGALKRQLRDQVKLVFADFQSTDGDKAVFRKELKALAKRLNMENDVVFMSEFDPSCVFQTPKQVVRDLLQLTDVYIHPSKSETYSLTTQEARACGSLLCLNYDFPPMRSLYGDEPVYRKFGAGYNYIDQQEGEVNVGYGDRQAYMADTANLIWQELVTTPTHRQRRDVRLNRNLNHVFEHFIEPLFFARIFG